MVDPHQTLVHSIWRTPSGRDLYEKINFSRPPFDPPHASTTTGAEAGPSGQPIIRPIEPTVNISTTSGKVHSET
jgi:hypothetical protein